MLNQESLTPSQALGLDENRFPRKMSDEVNDIFYLEKRLSNENQLVDLKLANSASRNRI